MNRSKRSPRGAAIVAIIMVMLLVNLIIVAMVLGGARDLDLAVLRMDTVRAGYAADGGAQLSLREVYTDTDIDGDGSIGSISDDGNDANNPAIGGGNVSVSGSTVGSATTYLSTGVAGSATRAVSTLVNEGSSNSAMIAYGSNGGSSTPKYRIWDGSNWGSESSANGIGAAPYWTVLRGSPVSNQFALAILDNDVDIEVQIWNGTSWGSNSQATNDAGDKTTRLFDLAYEQLSGHLLLVYRESGTSDIRYRTHNGSAWSSESSYTMTGNTVKWLTLVPKVDSDEIMLVAQSDHGSNCTRGVVWNGSSFTNLGSSAGAAGLSGTQHADIAFESTSGQVLFTFSQNNNTPGYRTLAGGSWSATANMPSVGGATYWSRLVSDPASDEILFASQDATNDINVNAWTGAAWGANTEVETGTASTSRRAMDVAYENGGNEALLMYDENSNTLKYRTWNGSGWSAEQSGPNGGNSPIHTIQAVTGCAPGEVLSAWIMDNGSMRAGLWTGSSFTALGGLGNTSGDKLYQMFMIATTGSSSSPPILASWNHVEP